MSNKTFQVGEPAPWFTARCTTNERFCFDSVGGRAIVLCFFGSAGDASSRAVLEAFMEQRQRFDDSACAFFGVSIDPEDERTGRVRQTLPGVRFFWDFDSQVSRLYRAVAGDEVRSDGGVPFRRFTLVLDARLRVLHAAPFGEPRQHVREVLAALDTAEALTEGPAMHAPVLVVPRVFEPALCQALIEHYDQHGGVDSGFMREVNGKTVGVLDHHYKRRADCEINDEALRNATMVRIHDRLAPQIARAFQFHATRMERYIVACYLADHGGHFRPHRDNTTRGTAHRRFAVSLNLNSGDYEGGELCFPEFGRRTYTAPAGGAVVFSCSLLHEATPVTRGRRYVFLPFLYDDDAARVREANLGFLGENKGLGAKVKVAK